MATILLTPELEEQLPAQLRMAMVSAQGYQLSFDDAVFNGQPTGVKHPLGPPSVKFLVDKRNETDQNYVVRLGYPGKNVDIGYQRIGNVERIIPPVMSDTAFNHTDEFNAQSGV